MSVAGREEHARGAEGGHGREPAPAIRFRLRFLLQEFDLAEGDTLIGRGIDCHITLHDPLVSRRHAEIRVDSEKAVLHDLGSRNGSRVNGKRLDEPRVLSDGDRIRIGTQELVFTEIHVEDTSGARRITGSLVYCGQCVHPYPREMGSCPNCGSTNLADVDPHAPLMSPGMMRVWAFELLVDLLQRALLSGQIGDIDRYLRQTLDALAERVAEPNPVDPARLQTLLDAAEVLIQDGREDTWLLTLEHVCAQLEVVLPPAVASCCTEMRLMGTTAIRPQINTEQARQAESVAPSAEDGGSPGNTERPPNSKR